MDIGASQLHYETIEKRARPARVAVLLDSSDVDWRHTALRVIEFLSSIWGGRHGIIVPTDGSTIAPVFWAILDKFSPDYVFFYAKTGDDIRISRPEEYADLLQAHIKANENDSVLSDQEKERIDQELRGAWAHQFGLTPDLCSQIADRLVPFHHEKHFEYITGHGYTPYQLTGILDVLPCVDHPHSVASFQVPAEIEAIWWAAQTGKYSAEVNQDIGSVGLSEERIEISEEDLGGFARWIAGGAGTPNSSTEPGSGRREFLDEKRSTPFAVSMSGLGLYGNALSSRALSKRFAYVVGDSLDDFCLSYCLPHIGHHAVWIPLQWVIHFEAKERDLLKSCAMSTLYAHPFRVAQDPGLKVCSMSIQSHAMEDVLAILEKRVGLGLNGRRIDAVADTTLVALATDALIPYCIDSPNQPEIYPFLGLESVGAIRSPRPTGFSTLSASKHRWVAEVSTVGRPVPAVPHVAEHLVKLPQSGGTHSARVSLHALAYTCPSDFVIGDDINPNLQNAEIRLFDTFTGVSTIAEANGYKSQLSDKGIYQRDSLKKLGGSAEAARIFRDSASRALLAKYLDHTDRPPGTYDEGCVLHGDKRAYLDLAAARKAMGGNEKATVTLLDKLAEAKILYRGFVLGCAVCKHAEWYSLADLADQFRCARCGREQIIRQEHWRHPGSPQVFYKLDEIIYQFLKSDGDVVVLSLDYMSRNSKLPFNFSPEIKFHDNGSQFTGEVDLCAVWDGDLTIGEAKKQGELAPSASDIQKIVKKYVHLANMLNARRVVFCTASPEWKNSTVEAVAKAFAGRVAVPRFLAAADLLASPLPRSDR
jgi:predicted RNA-binding Zn-ribbon protein involved in translation (DUF1610 family)